jgi:4-amino-4-deoxy-L-arabinose transferase-like glycosyltransferase
MEQEMKKVNFWLLLILVFAVFLRLYKLDNLELFGDELDVGYHAYSLLKTGRDYYGQKLPFYIHSLAEWRAPLLMYTTVPFVAVFGLNEWGIRLTPIFFGVLNIFLLYYLVKKLTKNEKLSLFSALLLAVAPWHIHYSRAAFEATLLLTLVLGGTIAFLKSKWLAAVLLFAFSFYAYNTANIFLISYFLFCF